MRRELVILQSDDDQQVDSEYVFVIEQELSTLQTEQFETIYASFATEDATPGSSFPLYRILWKWFTTPQTRHQTQLLQQVHLYKQLESRIKNDDISVMRCGDLDEKYRALIADVASSTGIDATVEPPSNSLTRLHTFVAALLGLSIFFADQLISLLLKHRFTVPETLKTIFIPSLGRFHSMESVLDSASYEFDVMITPMTLAWLRSRPDYPEIAAHDPIPMNTLITPGSLLREIRFLSFELGPQLLGKRFDRALTEFLSEQFDAEMPHSVAYEMDEMLDAGLLRSLLYYLLAEEIIQRYDCKTLVVNSASPIGKAIMAAGQEQGVELYHLRHSIVTGYTPSPPFGSTEFIEGPMASEYLESAEFAPDTSDFVETGYEYLADMYQKESGEFDTDEPISVFIGTQTADDSIRRDFIQHTLEGVNKMPLETDVIIKTHPDESAEFYHSVVDDYDVTIVEDELRSHLKNADLAITINSNVGLEAMLMKTPCISVNEWRPSMRSMPYVGGCHVPVIESYSDVLSFFEKLDASRLQEIYHKQQKTLEEKLILEGHPAQRIASHIGGNG